VHLGIIASRVNQLNELFVQFDNVATACQFYNAIHDSPNCLNDASSSETHI